MALIGCSPAPSHPFRVAAHPWPGYELFYLARALGFYENTQIRLIETTSASETSNALRNGIIEAGALTLDEALSLIQDGVDLHVVLVVDASHGADVLMANQEIADLASLRGKRIGVETGAVGAIMLDAALFEGNLKVSEVTVVPLNIDEHLAAWRKEAVDALVTYEPVRSQLLEEGAGVLFDSSRIPARILDVLVVNNEALEHHQPELKELIAGYFSALDYFSRESKKAAVLMAPRLEVRPESVESQFEGLVLMNVGENHKVLSGPEPKLNKLAADLEKLMLSRDLLRRRSSVTNLAESGFLPQASK